MVQEHWLMVAIVYAPCFNWAWTGPWVLGSCHPNTIAKSVVPVTRGPWPLPRCADPYLEQDNRMWKTVAPRLPYLEARAPYAPGSSFILSLIRGGARVKVEVARLLDICWLRKKCVTGKLPETNSSHLKIGHPKRKFHLPTMDFQRLC